MSPSTDRASALEAALQHFRQCGYVATTESDLLRAMQMDDAAFAREFTDKRGLFGEVLELFARRARNVLLHEWQQVGSPMAVRRYVEATLFEVPPRLAAQGCLLLNTIVELGDRDRELAALAADELTEIQHLIERCFREAIAEGSYEADQAPRELAEFAMLVSQSAWVAARQGVDRESLRRSVDNGMELLGLV